jgi:POT family proton-dependent oligopeptide transporter
MSKPAPSPTTTGSTDRSFFGHPRGLSTLFFTEMWERFSFYGMRALLVLYMWKALGYPKDEKAYPIYGMYGALVYAFPVIGGWIANKWLGYRHSIILGSVLMMLGQFTLMIQNEQAFTLALGLLCVGNGFFKPNISSTVGRLYSAGDRRRDGGFTIFYMGINLGAFLSPLVCSPLGERIDWKYGFGAAGVGMLIGLIWFLRGHRTLEGKAEPDEPELLHRPAFLGLSRLKLVWIGAFLVAPLVSLGFKSPHIGERLVQFVSVLVLLAIIGLAFRQDAIGRLRLFALIVLMFFHMLFWAGFEQAGSSFNVMTDTYVKRSIFGYEFPAGVFQSVNAAMIVLLAPFFSMLWRALQPRGWDPSIPMKFALALVQLGLGFWLLVVGIGQSDDGGRVARAWMILCYLLHTTGELCLSPVGLSAVTKLAPQKWVGFCMGGWFLTIANAHILAAAVAGLTSKGKAGVAVEAAAVSGKVAVQQYADVFQQVFYVALASAALLMLLTPFVKKLMKGVE